MTTAPARTTVRPVTTTTPPCPLCGDPDGHPADTTCHDGTYGAATLLQRALDKCDGDHGALARVLGMSTSALSHRRKAASTYVPGKPAPVLYPQLRFDVVQYLLGKEVHPPPRHHGGREQVDATKVAVHLTPHETRALVAAGEGHPHGMAGVLRDAVRAFVEAYATDPPRALPPYPSEAAIAAMERTRVHVIAPGMAAFDLLIGGPGWRRYYIPVALGAHLAMLARPPRAKARRA